MTEPAEQPRDEPYDEFDAEPYDDEPEPIPPQALTAMVALVAAAALAVFAPFQTLFTSSFQVKNGQTYELVADGWGRYETAAPTASHGVRFGVVLVACAALFVLSAAIVAAAAIDPPTWRPRLGAVTAGVIGVTGIVVGVVGSALLSIDSRADELARSFSDAASVSTSPGWFVWGLVGVVGFGAVAAVAISRLARIPRPSASGRQPSSVSPDASHADEPDTRSTL